MLGVWFPKAKLDALCAAAELVEHHPGRARMHGVVPKEPADRIECAILVVDTNIINPDPVLILLRSSVMVSSRSIDRGPSPGDCSAVMQRELASSRFCCLAYAENTPVCRGYSAANDWCAAPIASVGSTKPE
jgi:hypothetical protein